MLGLLLVLLLNRSSFPACVAAPAAAIADGIPISAVERHEVEGSISQTATERAVSSSSAYRLKFVAGEIEIVPTSYAIASSDGERRRRDVSPPTALSSLALGLFHPLRC
jgi:hypothetical protein